MQNFNLTVDQIEDYIRNQAGHILLDAHGDTSTALNKQTIQYAIGFAIAYRTLLGKDAVDTLSCMSRQVIEEIEERLIPSDNLSLDEMDKRWKRLPGVRQRAYNSGELRDLLHQVAREVAEQHAGE